MKISGQNRKNRNRAEDEKNERGKREREIEPRRVNRRSILAHNGWKKKGRARSREFGSENRARMDTPLAVLSESNSRMDRGAEEAEGWPKRSRESWVDFQGLLRGLSWRTPAGSRRSPPRGQDGLPPTTVIRV